MRQADGHAGERGVQSVDLLSWRVAAVAGCLCVSKENLMTIIHFATHAQVEALFKVFAKPVNQGDWIDWVAPAWWYRMYATAVR
jgi:hypothetical protein